MIVEPHSGTNNKWMLRVTAISAFDRWANSRTIDKNLHEYLSKEYDEVTE